MLSRKDIYWAQEGEPKTFDCDEGLPPLPLPKLEDTLERYYETLKPFGTKEELANSRRIIDEFKNGIGKKLHQIIKDKTKKEKNWVNSPKCSVVLLFGSKVDFQCSILRLS